jgi:hypothetical protein
LRAALRGADVIVFLGAAALLWLIVRLAHGVTVPWNGVTALSTVSTAPAELPYYAARSLLRMFAALALSIVFTFSFVYATAAAAAAGGEGAAAPAGHPAVGADPRVPAAKAGKPSRELVRMFGLSLRDAKTILAYTTTDGNERPPGP